MNPRFSLDENIRLYLAQLKQEHIHRQRSPVTHHDRDFLQFSRNDYLSIAQDKRILDAYAEGYRTYGSGSCGSMVICGYHAAHKDLEQAFADLLQVDDCLFFSSGYAANLAITRLLHTLNIFALVDKGVHASLYDGLQLSKIAFGRYLHNNMQDFARKSADLPENSLIITEGIFSMSGQKAALNTLAESGYSLIVDEAHSFGVLGEQGSGASAACHLHQDTVPLRIIPLGKACAGQGAIVAGQALWIDALLQSARSFIYSTAPAPGLAFGLRKTLEIVIEAEEKRQKLDHLIQLFRQAIMQSPLRFSDSQTPIQQLILGSATAALEISQKLKTQGIICMPVRYPTLQPKDSGLRIVLNAHHEEADIQHLFSCLHDINAKLSAEHIS